MMIRPLHLRMARAALGWSLKELAERAGVNMNTISRYEAGSQVMSGTISKIEAVLVREGVMFLDDDGELGPGVRLRRQLPLKLADVPQIGKKPIAKGKRKR
jgi:transcriptional regulator with XRE-family HTH domain